MEWDKVGDTNATLASGQVSPIPPPRHSPYLSRKRKKRVSTMVMRTPPQRGMLWDGKGGGG